MSGYSDDLTAAAMAASSDATTIDAGFIEYGDVQDEDSFARADSARPLLQKPACEHVLKS